MKSGLNNGSKTSIIFNIFDIYFPYFFLTSYLFLLIMFINSILEIFYLSSLVNRVQLQIYSTHSPRLKTSDLFYLFKKKYYIIIIKSFRF